MLIGMLAAVALLTTAGAAGFGVLLWQRGSEPSRTAAASAPAGSAPASDDPLPADPVPAEPGRGWRPSYGSLRMGSECVEYERRVCQCGAREQSRTTARARCRTVQAAFLEELGETSPNFAGRALSCMSDGRQITDCEHDYPSADVRRTAERIGPDCVAYLDLCSCEEAVRRNQCHMAHIVIGPSYDTLNDVNLTRQFCAGQVGSLRSYCGG